MLLLAVLVDGNDESQRNFILRSMKWTFRTPGMLHTWRARKALDKKGEIKEQIRLGLEAKIAGANEGKILNDTCLIVFERESPVLAKGRT